MSWKRAVTRRSAASSCCTDALEELDAFDARLEAGASWFGAVGGVVVSPVLHAASKAMQPSIPMAPLIVPSWDVSDLEARRTVGLMG